MDISYFNELQKSRQNFLKMSINNITKREQENELLEKENEGFSTRNENISVNINEIERNLKLSSSLFDNFKILFEKGKTSGVYGLEYYRIKSSLYEQFLNNSSKNIFLLDSIYKNIDDIVDNIHNIGPQNFNFRELKVIFKAKKFFEKAFKNYQKFFQIDSITGINPNNTYNLNNALFNNESVDKIRYALAVMSSNVSLSSIYEVNFSVYERLKNMKDASENIVNILDKIYEISNKYGKDKIFSGFGILEKNDNIHPKFS